MAVQDNAAGSTLDATALDLKNVNLKNVKTVLLNGLIDDGNSGTAKTIDWTTGQFHKLTLTGNCTLTFTLPTTPIQITLILIQDGVGSRTVTFPTTKWVGHGAAPLLTTTATTGTDIIQWLYDGTNLWGTYALDFV